MRCTGGRPCELPEDEPGHQETDVVHEAGLESIRHLQKESYTVSLRSVMGIGGSTLQNQKPCVVVMLSRSSYQYPEEEGELKRVLKEDEVDEVQDDPRPPEPEVLV